MRYDARKPAAKGSPRKGNKAKPAPDKPLLTADQWLDLFGYLLIGLALLTILSALSPGGQGEITADWLRILGAAFGWGVLLAPIVMGVFGLYLLLRRFGDRFPRLAPLRIVGVLTAFVAALMTLHIIGMA
ncbi:MAG: hypothetical protein ACUVR3_10380, partial [Candidatus Roseilinea sp.]